mmetsp:Transcript_13697/g.28104  ORF Transcript_13697/g.28104 Transcript_13697/m.28104 type:complete len:213 (-) Transcript_13697:35-673(-)
MVARNVCSRQSGSSPTLLLLPLPLLSFFNLCFEYINTIRNILNVFFPGCRTLVVGLFNLLGDSLQLRTVSGQKDLNLLGYPLQNPVTIFPLQASPPIHVQDRSEQDRAMLAVPRRDTSALERESFQEAASSWLSRSQISRACASPATVPLTNHTHRQATPRSSRRGGTRPASLPKVTRPIFDLPLAATRACFSRPTLLRVLFSLSVSFATYD